MNFYALGQDNYDFKNIEIQFVQSEEKERILRNINKSHANDVVFLTREAEQEIVDLWVQGKKFIPIPSDIFFAYTIPLKDFKMVVDESCIHGGRIYESRIVIFDYKEELEQSEYNSPVLVGAALFYGNPGKIIYPIYVSKGNNSIIGLEITTIGFDKNVDEEIKNIWSLEDVLNSFNLIFSRWYGIQIALLHPQVKTIFKNPQILKETTTKKNTKSKNKRKVRYIKKYVINKDDIEKTLYGEKRKINRRALAWYVIGHWREYKNGKKIFIQPYWKGALRETKKKIEERERIIDII